MKKFFTLLLIMQSFVWFQPAVIAQQTESTPDWDLLMVREDIVYPGRTSQYEAALNDFRVFLTKNKVKGFSYYTHIQDDYHYTHIIPIENSRELSEGLIRYVGKKVDSLGFAGILNDMVSTISSYRNYLVKFRPDLSYLPEGSNWMQENGYRKWSYLYFQPGSHKEVEKVLLAWQSLYREKGIEFGFRVFEGFLGIEQPLYILTTWGKNPLDYEENVQQAMDKLGDEGTGLWAEVIKYVRDVKTVEGWFLPQYSYYTD